MASRKDNLKGLIQNSRTRVIIIITALILIFTMFYGYVHFSSSEAAPKQSKLRLAPNIDSIPGALNQTAEYTSLQNKQNSEQAKKALESGSSAIPTIINVQKFGDGVNEIGPQGGRGGLGFSSLAKLNNGSIKPLWAEDLENSNCNIKSLKSAIENGANIETLKEYCSCQQLKDYGFKINDLNSVCDCGELRLMGFSALELKNIGFNAGKLRECGYSACEEKAAGFSASDMKKGGFPDAELKGAGFSNSDLAQASGLPFGISAQEVLKKGCGLDAINELKAKGVSASAIRHISGCSIDQLKKAGFSANDLKDAGFTAADLLNAGYSPISLNKAGFSAKDLSDAGVSPEELAAAGFSAKDIKRELSGRPTNITPEDIKQNGCTVDALKQERQLGISAKNLSRLTKCSAEALLKAGYTPDELAAAGYANTGLPLNVTADDIREAGCAPEKIAKLRKAGVKAETIMMISKCPLEALKAAGFTAADLLRAGVSPEQLANAGFSPDEIKDGQAESSISPEDIRKAGCAPEKIAQLRKAGVKAETIMAISKCPLEALKAAGFTAADLLRAGVSPEQLANAGFSPDEIKDGQAESSISPEDIRKAGCAPEKIAQLRKAGVKAETIMAISKCPLEALKAAGFIAGDLLRAGVSPEQLANAGFSPDEIKQGQAQSSQAVNAIREAGCAPEKIAQLRKAGVKAETIMSISKCPLEALKAAGFNAADLLRAGASPEQLANAGFSPGEIKDGQAESSIRPEDIRKAGCAPEKIAQLRKAGVKAEAIMAISKCPLEALKAAGFTAADLLQAGVSPEKLSNAGFSPDEIQQGQAQSGISTDDIAKAGCSPEKIAQLRKAGVKAEAIMMISKCPLEGLKAAGFTAADLLQAGVSPEKLANAGFSPDQIVAAQDQVDKDLSAAIKAAGCDPDKLAKLQKKGVSALAIVKANGCDPRTLKQAGFTARDLLKAGFTPNQLTAAGFSPKDIQDAQNSAINSLTGAKNQTCTPEVAAKAKAQGMTATELRKTLGCSLAALKAAGFSAKELMEAGFTPGELAQAGYTLPELLAAGFTPTDLKAAGFSPEELVAAGVSPKELLGAGFTPTELLKAGVSAKDLLAAGVSAEDLKAAGLSADELKKAGVSDAILEKLGINPKIAALADIADINLKKNDEPSVSSMLKGGNESPTIKQNTEKLDKLVAEQKKSQAQQKFQQKIQTQVTGMQSYAQQLISAWKTSGTQAYVAGRVKAQAKDEAALTTASGSVAAVKGEAEAAPESMNSNNAPTVKTGDILFAVVDTAVNTDEPGPLLATITNGPLKGAKLIGSFSAGSSQAEKLTISFNSLSVPWLIKTIGISAYAIDPNTGRTALSSSTNHHYLERYGALFASTFLEGFGNAFQSADTTITVGGTGGETNTTVQNGINRSLTDNAVIGLATLGKAWGQQAARNMNKPTTIQIYSGTPVGVLFLQDVNIPEK